MFSEPINNNGSISGSISGSINGSINGDINKNKILVLDLIKSNPKITRKSISEQLSKSIRSVDRIIETLKNNDVIERVGGNKSGSWIIK